MRSWLELCAEGARLLGIGLVLAWLCGRPGEAQTATCPAKLEIPNRAAGDLFGCAVSLSGDLLVAGSLFHRGSGSAQVFERVAGGWSTPVQLLGSDRSDGDQFGFSVAVSGPYVVVGAPFHKGGGTAAGATYVFRCDGLSCVQEDALTAAEVSPFDHFGFSVAIDGTTAVVGAPGAGGKGMVEIFERTGGAWIRRDGITASEAAAGDGFGFAAAIRDDTLIAGSPYDDDAGESSGTAWIFQRSGGAWLEQRKLVADDASAADLFGFSVAMADGTAVVGARGNGGGAAYVFDGSGNAWSSGLKLAADGLSGGDQFGISVAIDAGSDRVLVGARFDDDQGADAGTAYVFRRSGGTWSQTAVLNDPRVQAGDEFGLGAAIEGDVAVLGAYRDDDPADAGAVYGFFLNGGAEPVCGADLELIKSGPASILAGTTVTYQLTTTNSGPENAVGTILGDPAPLGLAFVRATDPCMGGFPCELGDLNEGESAQVEATFAVTADACPPGTGVVISNAATVSSASADPQPGNNRATTEANCRAEADLELSNTSPDSVAAGGISTYELTVANLGPSAAVSVMLDHPTAAGFKLIGASEPCDKFPCSLPDLPPGSSTVVEVELLAPPTCSTNSVEISATVSAVTPDPDVANDETSIATEVVGCADLSTSIDADLSDLCAGEELSYEITISNEGEKAIPGALVRVDFDTQLEAVTWECSGPEGSCTPMGTGDILEIVSLPASSSVVYTALATLDLDSDSVEGISTFLNAAGAGRVEHTVELDCQPTPLGSDFQINTDTFGYQRFPSVAAGADGNFIVIWDSESDSELYLIKARRFTSAGDGLGPEVRVDSILGYSFVPAVAFDSDSNFVVVWNRCDSPDSCTSNIYGQRFLSDGSRAGAEFQINTFTTGSQRGRLGLDFDGDGGFVVVWHSTGSSESDQSSFSIQGRRFASDGSPEAGEFQVNSFTQGLQYMPSVAVNPDGSFAVVWQSAGSSFTDHDNLSIQGRLFDADGLPAGPDFQINSYITYRQDNPRVAADAAGNFVVVWNHCESSLDADGRCPANIRGQRFASAGSMQGEEFQVNSFTTGNQDIAFVASEPGGNFVVVWHSQGSSGSDNDALSVQGQRYTAAGLRIGGEFQVNSFIAGCQGYPWVATDSGGNFVVVWQSDESGGNDNSDGSGGTDTSDTSIQGRRFSPPYADTP